MPRPSLASLAPVMSAWRYSAAPSCMASRVSFASDATGRSSSPEGYILFCRNPDQPGMIGRVGMVLGKAKVNIRHMDVGPIVRTPHPHDAEQRHKTALMIVSVDEPIPDWALEEIGASGDIFGLTLVKL